ncbi:NADH-quinone oxidoreductase subunit NuoF [Anaerovorax odorimutans]|uniref:NADH-quinone oxidoreductase subunit NuoF n=1 Tax=Anaerovorax odorimutans TaxID=109327 RepID=UPI0003F776DE|nr:NADH-quinone oxidoreductase subunit NuoF [Anaerovorax odorimutans]
MSDRKVMVCCGTGCLANGSKKVLEAFKDEIEKQKLNIEVVPYVKSTGCNGLCERGPIVKIEPDDIAYYHVKTEDVKEIVSKTIAKGEEIQRLLYLDSKTKKRIRSHKDSDFIKKQTKIALRNIGEIDPCDINDYLNADGYKALKKALFEMSNEDIINEIKASGLRGRGGGGFPTGVKWESCYKIDRPPKYIICNGDEGDPGAFMDRSIMEGDPHTVLEGMIIASIALNSQNGYIYIRDEYGLALENMHRAINQAKDLNFLGDNILGSNHSFDIEIVRGGGAFVCGESSALMASIEGKAGEPRAKYIRSAEFGLWGQPTVLNNVETWANVPVIIQKGSEWFSKIGSPKNSGTKVFSLVGKVKNTGLVEVPMGITLQELIFDIGGGIVGDKEFKAVQTGGPSGGCIPKELMNLGVDFDTLSDAGSMMGSGGIIVTDERTCMVEFARYYVAFLAEESCGKCVSCREGIRQMLKILTDICEGKGKESDLDLLTEIAHMVEQASLCGLGKTAPNPVMSTLKYFRDEYLEHIIDKRCRAGVCKALTEFYIDKDKCIGCGLCKRGCAPEAIEGNAKMPHIIDQDKCIKCGNCIDLCKFKAVKVR